MVANPKSPSSTAYLSLCEDGYAVTPNDSTDLSINARYFWLDVGGTVVLNTIKGTTLTFLNVPSGFFFQPASRIKATGTTATGIKALL